MATTKLPESNELTGIRHENEIAKMIKLKEELVKSTAEVKPKNDAIEKLAKVIAQIDRFTEDKELAQSLKLYYHYIGIDRMQESYLVDRSVDFISDIQEIGLPKLSIEIKKINLLTEILEELKRINK